jgi:predicted nucleic acid-binding protein
MISGTDKSPYGVLIDSDAFVGLLYEKDAHHQKAVALFSQLENKKIALVSTNYIILETATVLSHRQGQSVARMFLKFVQQIPIIHIGEALHKQSLDLFRRQIRRGTSVVDCSNVVLMKHYGIPKIFSFDKVYAKDFGQRPA